MRYLEFPYLELMWSISIWELPGRCPGRILSVKFFGLWLMPGSRLMIHYGAADGNDD
jgi:hypothetical protein